MWGSVNILTAVFRAKSPQLRGIQTEAQVPISSTGIAALRAFKGRSRDLAVILCSSVCWGHLRDLVQSFWVYWGGYRELYVLRTPWSAKFIVVFPTCATACTLTKIWSIDWYRFDISCARSIDRDYRQGRWYRFVTSLILCRRAWRQKTGLVQNVPCTRRKKTERLRPVDSPCDRPEAIPGWATNLWHNSAHGL